MFLLNMNNRMKIYFFTLGDTKEELQTEHLVLHPVKFPPPRGEIDNPTTKQNIHVIC